MTILAPLEDYILRYKISEDSTELVEKYKPFIQKYHDLITKGIINFRNYDLRYFLSLYIKDDKIVKNLRGIPKYHKRETIRTAFQIAKILKHRFLNYSEDEVYHELIIALLECARIYEDQGVGFQRFLYRYYKFILKNHIKSIHYDIIDFQKHISIYDIIDVEEWEDHDEKEETEKEDDYLFYSEDMELNHPRWIHGNKSKYPFNLFTPHERYILVEYYIKDKTDKDIARMLPYHPKSIHRIRQRLICKLHDLYDKGELNCIRIP